MASGGSGSAAAALLAGSTDKDAAAATLRRFLLRFYPPGLLLEYADSGGARSVATVDLFGVTVGTRRRAAHAVADAVLRSHGLPRARRRQLRRLVVRLAAQQSSYRGAQYSLWCALRPHASPLANAALSKGGLIATCGYDRSVRLWRVVDASAGGDEAAAAAAAAAARPGTAMPGGRTVGTMEGGGSSGRALRVATCEGHGNVVACVAFNNPYASACVGAAAGCARVCVSACVLWVCARVYLRAHVCVCGGPSRRGRAGLVASGAFDHTVRLWDTAAGGAKAVLSGHTGEVVTLEWAHDGRRLVSGSMDKTAAVWDGARGERVATLAAAAGAEVSCVGAAAWHPEVFLSADMAGAVQLWDVRSPGAPSCALGGGRGAGGGGTGGGRAHAGAVAVAALSPAPDHVLTASADGSVALWDTRRAHAPARVLANFRGEATCAAWSATGGAACAGGSDGRVVYSAVTPAGGGEAEALGDKGKQHNGGVSCVAFNSQGTAFASSGADGCARVYDVSGGIDAPRVPQILAGPHGADVFRVLFSYTGDHVVTAATDTTVAVWRALPRLAGGK